MIDDVITYDTWHHLCQKYLLTLIITNLWWHKMCKKDVVFPPIILIVAYITMAYQNLWGNIWCYKFNSSNSARYLKFYCWKVESSRVELRIDREGVIDDVITYITWHHLCQKYLVDSDHHKFVMTQNVQKRCCFPTNHINCSLYYNGIPEFIRKHLML